MRGLLSPPENFKQSIQDRDTELTAFQCSMRFWGLVPTYVTYLFHISLPHKHKPSHYSFLWGLSSLHYTEQALIPSKPPPFPLLLNSFTELSKTLDLQSEI